MSAAVSDRIEADVWRIAFVVIVGSIMSILDTTIVNVALDKPSRSRSCEVSLAHLRHIRSTTDFAISSDRGPESRASHP